MNWLCKLRWYNFLKKLDWTENQRIMISEWSTKLAFRSSWALLDFISGYLKDYGKQKTILLMDSLIKTVDHAVEEK